MFSTLNQLLGTVPNEDKITNIDSIGTLGVIILNVALGVSFSMSIIMLAFGAFRYVASSGDPKLMEKAWHSMFWSFLAGLVTLISLVIKAVVVRTYGITAPDIVNDKPNF